MAIQDNSWSLEEMNYTLSLVVAVPDPRARCHTMPSSGIAVCDGQLDYMCRNIVNRDTNVYNTWLVGLN